MDKLLFRRRFGVLYDGLKIGDEDRRKSTIRHVTWFCVRRLLFALAIVKLRDQIIWVQLSANVWLCLADACAKLHYFPYESRLGGLMEVHNETYVLFCSYMMFLFTDFVLTIENKFYFGWFFGIAVLIMTAINIAVLIFNGIKGAYR